MYFSHIHLNAVGSVKFSYFFFRFIFSIVISIYFFFQLTLFKLNEFIFKIEKRLNEYLEINVVHLLLFLFCLLCFALLCFVTAFVWLENSVDWLYWTSRFTCVEFACYIKSQIFLKSKFNSHAANALKKINLNWNCWLNDDEWFERWLKLPKTKYPANALASLQHHSTFQRIFIFNGKTDITMMEKIHTHTNVITNANTKFPNAVVNYWNMFRSQGRTDWVNCTQNECEQCYIGGICICVWAVMNVKCITQLAYKQTLWNMLNY